MEKPAYRDILEMLNAAFPDHEVLNMSEVSKYMRMDRRTLLQDKKFPVRCIAGRYAIHKAALARYLA